MSPALEEMKRILLREWDPIGVRDIPGAEDEYDDYALRIYTMLKGGASEGDVAGFLDWARGNMGLASSGDHDRAIAARIVAAQGS